MKGLLAQFTKFGIVGAIAFVIDYGLMVLLTELGGIDPVISAAISFTVSVLFNYFASMRYVFEHRSDLSREKEMFLFITLSVIGLALNEAIMVVGVDFVGISYLIVKLFATAVVTIWNFWSRRKWLDAGSRN